MRPGTWEHAVERLNEAAEEATAEQLNLAKIVGLAIPPKSPAIVAAALLRVALSKELHLPSESPVSEHFGDRLKGLRGESKHKIKPQSDQEAAAWVEYLRLVRRKRVLSELKPDAGDVVKLSDGEKIEVSSIGPDGRVYFKGGRGYRSWPDLIRSVVARKDANSAAARKARQEAENAAAVRASSPEWSAARSEELAEFAVEKSTTDEDINELEDVIDRAADEKPVQRFLEQRPYLITSLLGGKERFCLPQKSLGGKYIPDFVIGDVDSLGIRWVLVELETPQCGIYLKDGSALDKYARKGVDQVTHWRDWLLNNIGLAQRPRAKHGLGLPDISSQAEGLVLVGRRAKRPKTTDAVRKELRHRSNIRVHSYDWFLEKLRGAISFDGPPGSNPYLISRPPLADPFDRFR